MKKGWQKKALDEVCSITSALVDPSMTKYEDMLHVGGANIESATGKLVDLKTVKEEGLKSGKFVFDDSMVLYSKIRPYLMKVARPNFKGLCSADIYPLTPDPAVLDRGYLFHQLLSPQFTEFAVSGSARAGMPKVNREHLFTFQFPLPPLPEQHRIVGLLDEAFAGLATAQANAEKNHQNARALFESHLQSVFSQRRRGWVETRLGDVCEFENGDRGKNYPNRNEYVELGIPWINTGHIQPDGTLSMEEMNFITREKFNSLRSGKIEPGDLVYCLRGATLGKTALVAPLTEGAVASSLVIVRPSSLLDSRFLYFFLTSPPGQRLIRGFENGAAQPNLGARSVARYPISIPTTSEQTEIADSLVELREQTQRLAMLYSRKLTALAALKQSLLHRAFSGEL